MNLKSFTAVLLASAAITLAAEPTQCSSLDKAAGWEANKKCTFSDGTITSNSSGLLFVAGKPSFQQVTIKAKVTVEKATSHNWKTAGLVIYQNKKLFWKFSLVERPDKAKKTHFLELKRMKGGKWGNTKGLKRITWKGFKWETGKTYVMEMKITTDSIIGTITDETGKERGKIGFKYGTDKPEGGIPAIQSGGFVTKFADVSIEGEK